MFKPVTEGRKDEFDFLKTFKANIKSLNASSKDWFALKYKGKAYGIESVTAVHGFVTVHLADFAQVFECDLQ